MSRNLTCLVEAEMFACIVGFFSEKLCLSGRTILSPFVRLAPNKNKKQFLLNALNSFPMCPSLLSTPFRQLHVVLTHQRSVRVYTAVSMLEESRHRPCVCVTAAPTLHEWHACANAPVTFSIYVCCPSRSLWPIDRPPFEIPLRCSCSSPRGDTCYGAFLFLFLRSACQQAASNCYIFSWQKETDHITSRDVA